jgi:hypothetical protein
MLVDDMFYAMGGADAVVASCLQLLCAFVGLKQPWHAEMCRAPAKFSKSVIRWSSRVRRKYGGPWRSLFA